MKRFISSISIVYICMLILVACSADTKDSIREAVVPGIATFAACAGGSADRSVDVDLPGSTGVHIDNSTETNRIAEILAEIEDEEVKNDIARAWLDCYEKPLPPVTHLGCQADIYETSRSSHVLFNVSYNNECLSHSRLGLLMLDPYAYFYFKQQLALPYLYEGVGETNGGSQEIHFEPQWPRPAVFTVHLVSYPSDMDDVVAENTSRRSLKSGVHILASHEVTVVD